MKNERFDEYVAIGIATITTPTGREPICIAFRGAVNDTIYLRPSQPLTPSQQNEAVAQACSPHLIETAIPAEHVPHRLAEVLKGKRLFISEIYEDLKFAHHLRDLLKRGVTWSTLHPLDQIPGRTASASSAAESVYEQLQAIYTTCPTFENRIPHIVDKMIDDTGEWIGFSIAGPMGKHKFAGIIPDNLKNQENILGLREMGLAFAADQILMASQTPRIKIKYATPEVRKLLDKALRDTCPEGKKPTFTVTDYENSHPLDPANPHNRIAEYDPADYPGG